ncbi:amino acid permease [Corynebacterium epidermidicanis]|uniref:Gamma-aminobutyrate permease-like transporter n=1 Tax=Corynebacterium epidermidicanis TaxID=1050174 RepID=A0A0G3GNL0_9CORY|nr:amino acid permease [Corynebacterium epidermidicanis]AKK02816.1 gamma-aminobutyrate permease-like transporter [Corynebacterium epidermidicanis]
MTRDTSSQATAAQPATVDSHLGTGLKTRHLTMMGLGSAIGAGLFLGTGVGINIAGPAILLAYIVAGIIVVFVMQMLGEMAAARPASGSFSTYAEMAFGHTAGFAMGWLYWFMLVMVMGAEMTGAAAIMGSWFGVSPWIPALICVVIFAVINLAQVGGFGEFEFWFAFIKVFVITVFLVISVLLVFGLLPGTDFVGTANFIGEHGFMPNGITGVAAGLLAVAFAFGGIEIVTIAAAESENPRESIATAVRSVIWRISVFYLGSVLAICFLMPYAEISGAKSAAESPFTVILGMAGIPGIAKIMEIVIVLSLLSAFNAQIYATSRFVYTLAEKGDAPSIFARLNAAKVPNNAVLLSVFFAFASVGLQYWNPAGLLEFLLNAVGGCLIVIWLVICFSYLKLHNELERNNEITVRMWAYPVLPWVTVAMLLGLTALMLFDPSSRGQITSVSLVCVVLVALSFLTRPKKASH